MEELHDIVERVLIDSSYYRAANAYILNREHHAQIRAIKIKDEVDLVENCTKELGWEIRTRYLNFLPPARKTSLGYRRLSQTIFCFAPDNAVYIKREIFMDLLYIYDVYVIIRMADPPLECWVGG